MWLLGKVLACLGGAPIAKNGSCAVFSASPLRCVGEFALQNMDDIREGGWYIDLVPFFFPCSR